MRLPEFRVFSESVGSQGGWLLLASVAAVLAFATTGCTGDDDSAEYVVVNGEGDSPSRGEPTTEGEPAVLEVVNTYEASVAIHRNDERRPVLELAPHEIGRVELELGTEVQLYVADAGEHEIRHPGIEFTPIGNARYVWDLHGRGRFVQTAIRQGKPTGEPEPPHPYDSGFERLGVSVFRVRYGLLDAATEIEPRRGRAPRKVYRHLATRRSGEIEEVPADLLEAALFRQPEAYLPQEQSALVPRAVQAWPGDYGMRLLPLVRLGDEQVIGAVSESLIAHPDPSLARHLRERLREVGAESVPEPKRRAYARILAACGTRSDLEAVWEATTHHVGRRHLLLALQAESGSPVVVEFFLRRLLSDDPNLVHEAWEFLLEPVVLRDPMVLATAKMHIETNWTITQEVRDAKYRRLLRAAFPLAASTPYYPADLVDWVMLEVLHRLDSEEVRRALEHFVDKRAEGIRILHEAFPHLPPSKRRMIIARPLIDEHRLYPELEALLFDAVNDRYWEDIARPALRRLVRDGQMRNEEFRTKIRERIDEVERPVNRRRALALFQEGWRTMLMNLEPESLGMTEEARREQLLEWVLHGVDSQVARHSFESLWEVLQDEERAELLQTFVARFDEVPPDNRAIILFALIDHVRLFRDLDAEPWVEKRVVRSLTERALRDDAPGVREIAFGTLARDRQWYREPYVRKLLDEAVLAEPRGSNYHTFRAILLEREAREASRRVRQGDPVAREFLSSLLNSNYDRAVVAAIDGLARANCDDAIDVLVLQYYALTPPMRVRTLLALAEARTLPVEIYVEAARSERMMERRMVYRALLKRLDRTGDDYLEELLQLLISREPDADLRDAFAEWVEEYQAEPATGTMPNW